MAQQLIRLSIHQTFPDGTSCGGDELAVGNLAERGIPSGSPAGYVHHETMFLNLSACVPGGASRWCWLGVGTTGGRSAANPLNGRPRGRRAGDRRPRTEIRGQMPEVGPSYRPQVRDDPGTGRRAGEQETAGSLPGCSMVIRCWGRRFRVLRIAPAHEGRSNSQNARQASALAGRSCTRIPGRVEVGYVLNENGSWLPILRSGERRLVRYRETQVEKRALCQLRPKGLLANRTAWQALGPHSLTEVSEPACPHGFTGNP
jgi:hypothetical protein